ncbi:MAG: hypothetical protein FJW31_04000 [Acidobacteria bacterium]|nr:hypothetical protein [Acidobacteriota bacterium]
MHKPTVVLILTLPLVAAAQPAAREYRVLATTKTSTMEKELNEAAEVGYGFSAAMGGSTAAGNEVVVVMTKLPADAPRRSYRLLATNRTSTMQKELTEFGNEGFDYKGQTVFSSAFGGREVAVILERLEGGSKARILYRLQATSRTSTMQKELNQMGEVGYEAVGLTVAQTSLGGNELVCILRKRAE